VHENYANCHFLVRCAASVCLHRSISGEMPPKPIYEKPTEQELAALPRALHSGPVGIIKRSWIYDHAKKQLQHSVKELTVKIGPLVGKGKRTYWCQGLGEYSHIVTQISSKNLGTMVECQQGGNMRSGHSDSSGVTILCPHCLSSKANKDPQSAQQTHMNNQVSSFFPLLLALLTERGSYHAFFPSV
jgi:Zn finger protein HypA/HybF involved in hydrogenase expression